MDRNTIRKARWGAAVLAAAAAVAGAVSYPYLAVSAMRRNFKKNDDRRDEGLETPEGVRRIDDIPYGDGAMQVMDVYRPAEAEGPLPCIVSVHGGGYFYGTKETYQYYCMDLALRGFAVVNFSYRLAPAHKFPVQLQDVNEAVVCAVSMSEELGIDTGNMFFVGDSAGAQLLSQYAAAWADPEYAAALGLEVPGFSMNAVALNCGMYEIDRSGLFGRIYVGRGTPAELLDVKAHIGEGYPPCFVMSSTGDFLRENAAPMGEFLESQGVESVVRIYGDEETRPGHVFHVDVRDPIGRQSNDDECAFFRAHLK